MLLEGHIKRLFLQFLFTSFEMRLDRVVRPQASALPPFCPKHLVQSQFSLSVLSDSWQLHGLQHTRPHCPSPTPRAYPNSCPPSWWCHPTISSSVIPFSRPQPFPASGSFQMSQFFTSGGQSIRVSVSASVLPVNIQDWFLLGLISFRIDWLNLLAVQGLSSLLQHHSSKASIL